MILVKILKPYLIISYPKPPKIKLCILNPSLLTKNILQQHVFLTNVKESLGLN